MGYRTSTKGGGKTDRVLSKMTTEGNDSAYPSSNSPGLTKREFFAAMALQGMLSDPEDMEMEGEGEDGMDGEDGGENGGEYDGNNKRMQGESCTECCCRLAVEHADQLIRELNK